VHACSTYWWMMRHSLVSCSSTMRATALTGMAEIMAITIASNSRAKPLPGRAHGTLVVRTLHRPQRMRATRALR
jgi:hypothetical protein